MRGTVTTAAIAARYRNSYAWAGGYLPKNREAAHAWLREFTEQATEWKEEHVPSVAALAQLIDTDAVVKEYVTAMIEQVPQEERVVSDIPHLLQCLDKITVTAPAYAWNPDDRIFFPMSNLFVHMMATDGGWNAFRNKQFNEKLSGILGAWYEFLNSGASCSVLNDKATGWFSQPAYEQFKLYEFELDRDKPYWGFTSYNDFFHRKVKLEFRELATDDNAVVSANDGTVLRYRQGVKRQDQFWLKGQPYSLETMLNGSQYVEKFADGDVFQSFLSGADYHRWHAPVAGEVVAVEKVPGYTFAELQSMGEDPSAGTHSQCYGASVNTRGIVIIKSTAPDIGYVGVMPIGITEISSITHTVAVNHTVEKGQDIGHFSFGGSSMCLLFEKNAVELTAPDNRTGGFDSGAPIFVNAQIARAK